MSYRSNWGRTRPQCECCGRSHGPFALTAKERKIIRLILWDIPVVALGTVAFLFYIVPATWGWLT